MRNDIKRFFVAVLAACGLAVSAALAAPSYQAELGVTQKNYYVDEKGGNVSPYAAAATAAPDITDRLQNLGIPLIGRYPDGRITQSTYARNVWDMKYHDGKVFFGSGNSANTGPSPNAGPAEVWEIDPATGTAQLSYKIGGEQADLFRVFSDGCLYVPDHDPPGTSSYNCYYKRDTSGNWSNGGWLTGEVHVYDMAEFDGKMFACGSGNYLWCSEDGGANWYQQKRYPLAGRKYAFLPYGDQLMTSTSYYDWNSGDVFRYWDKAQKIWAVPDPISAARAFPDQKNLPGNDLKLVRPAQFGNKCLYIGAYEFNDHQNDPFGAYVSTFDGTKFSATAIPAATGQVPWDILVKDGVVYLLVQDKTLLANTDRRYVNRVFASTDAASWTELFSFRATTFAMSFEKVGDTFYFGMGTKDRVCDECGTIYRVNPTASEPPPPALPTAAFASAAQTVQENAGTVSISVVLSQASSSAVSIPFTLGGTALAGADYQIPASPLTIPAGQTSGTIDIVLAADGLAEPAETIIVVLGTPTGATLGATTTHTLTIAASEASAALAAPSYQAQLTVQGYDGAELADFPVLVRLSPQTVNGFHYGTCKADGSDVVFVDENGKPLAYQLDTWDPSGESLFWVKLPQLAKGKSFHVRWGDSQSNVDGARSAATWNANYGAVWHMGEASGVCANSTVHGSAYDATPMGETSESVRYDGNDAPVGGARTTSKGKNAYLVVPNYDALQCGDTFTFSGWMRLTGTCNWGNPLSRKAFPDENSGWEMMLIGSSLSQVRAYGRGSRIEVTFEEPGFDKTWAHFALVYSGKNVSVYGNGALLKSGTVQAVNDNGLPLYIGNDEMASFHFVKGAFDELRLMKGAASADWVKAEHDTVAKADFLAYGASGPAWTAPSLCISGVGVAASGDSFVDLSAMLHGLGENATEASIQLAYGFDETSLVKTQTVGTATATGPMTFRLDRLLPQRVYCVQVVAVNDQGERAVSDPVHVMTAVSQDASGNAGDLLAIRVDEVIADGELQKLTLTFPPAEEARDLYAAWGGQHGGATTNGWTHVQKLTTVAPGCGTYEYTLPGDWGAEDNTVIRFFLDGTPRSCSSSVYWRDCSEPWLTGLSLDGRGGDTLKVTGSLASFAGSSCTLTVLVGRTPEALDQEWTGLEGSGLQAPGSFDLTLFEDTESQKYLNPGETYYVCVEATAGDSVSRSQVMQVTMAEEDAFESATASVSRRTVTFSGVLAGRGMGESAKVSLWVGEENGEGTLEQVGEELDVQGGAFKLTHKFNDFERTYYWQLRAVSTSAGETAVVTTRTAVASCTTADSATYTWNGSADDYWDNPANWGNSGGDAFGYPNGTQTTVQFPAGTKAQIVLRKAMSVGTLNLDKQDCEVTFARAAGQEAVELEVKNNRLQITGARLRLALDGVALRTPGLRFSASEGEVRLSNGASWYLSGRLENMDGGELWLGPGTSLSCSDYWFGGGLTVIDDATFEVRASAVLGKSKPGGKIRFVGTQPAFRCTASGANVCSDLEAANVRLEFALPAGGYATPPFVNASANPNYILGYNGNNKRLWPITVDIAPDSPAAFAQQKTETTLISWGKGICPEIIQTAAQPGANATFVWSEEKEGENPVSLGVRLAPAGFIIRVR